MLYAETHYSNVIFHLSLSNDTRHQPQPNPAYNLFIYPLLSLKFLYNFIQKENRILFVDFYRFLFSPFFWGLQLSCQ
jgi:hypothetical protein